MSHRHRTRVPQVRCPDGPHPDRDPGLPPGGRLPVRPACRPLRPATAAHDRSALLLGGGSPLRPGAQLHHVSRPASAVRNRHGRRVGRWCVARDGKGSGEAEGRGLGLPPAGIRDGVPAGSALQHPAVRQVRLAAALLPRRAARHPGGLCAHARQGIGSLAKDAPQELGAVGPCHPLLLEAVSLYRLPHDRDEPGIARHAGPVSDLSRTAARVSTWRARTG